MGNVSHWVAEDNTWIRAQKIPASKRRSSSHWCSRWRCSFDLSAHKKAFSGWISEGSTWVSNCFSLQASGEVNVALSSRRGTGTRGLESPHCGQLRPAGSFLGILWWEQCPVLMFLKADPTFGWLFVLKQNSAKIRPISIYFFPPWCILSAWTHFLFSGWIT